MAEKDPKYFHEEHDGLEEIGMEIDSRLKKAYKWQAAGSLLLLFGILVLVGSSIYTTLHTSDILVKPYGCIIGLILIVMGLAIGLTSKLIERKLHRDRGEIDRRIEETRKK